MKPLRWKVRRRRNGKFQAVVENAQGVPVWMCPHHHTYGTSNSPYKDAASKCAYAKVKELRSQQES